MLITMFFPKVSIRGFIRSTLVLLDITETYHFWY